MVELGIQDACIRGTLNMWMLSCHYEKPTRQFVQGTATCVDAGGEVACMEWVAAYVGEAGSISYLSDLLATCQITGRGPP